MTNKHSNPIRPILGGLSLTACALGVWLAVGSGSTTAQPAAPAPAKTGPSDHVMFGGTPSRNMVNLIDKKLNIPTSGPNWENEEEAKKWSAQWVLWKAELGSKAYGGPTIAGGKIYVGTNNGTPRNKRDTKKSAQGEVEPIDKGVIMAFDEKTGAFLWQAIHDKLSIGRAQDWPEEGICSSPAVDGNKVYYVSNRCTVVCADVNGLNDGKQGAVERKGFTDPTDADFFWEFDMVKELNVYPHNMAACSPLIVGDIVFIVTGNGVDEGHLNIPSPLAPSFIALDKKTGKLLWKSNVPGKSIMHGQWSNPVYGEINGVRQVVFPGGDGWIRGFVPETGEELWKFDCNPKDSCYELGGAGTRSDFVATPVIHDGKVYIGVGQDPEHSTGIGHFWCISPTKRGDISPTLDTGEKKDNKPVEKPNAESCVVWHYGGEETRKWSVRDFSFGRTMSTACIVDDILYISELTGILHCMNAKTGEHYWQHDTKANIWGSAYYVDGKVLLTNDQGDLFVFRHDPKPQKFDETGAAQSAPNQKEARAIRKKIEAEVAAKYLLGKVSFPNPIRSTPIVANGVLYVMTEKHLFALKTK